MHQLIEALPAESLVYLGDTGRYPYGSKSPETVTRYSLENAAFLVDKGIKLLVVACNAASSVALGALTRRMPRAGRRRDRAGRQGRGGAHARTPASASSAPR